jgi:uncharacterized surface protein with fasciclin (FAS1) repeats
MKILSIKTILLCTVLAFTTIAFFGCKKEEIVIIQDDLDATIKKDAELSLFYAAIEKLKLQLFTKGPGPFTIFAPTNAAFNAMGINTAADFNSYDSVTLTSWMLYHFQNVRRPKFEIPAGPNTSMSSMNGQTTFASRNTKGVFINGITVTSTDIIASNGIVHKLSKVLLRPTSTVTSLLTADPDLKLMMQAITKTSSNTSTWFAPSTASPITVFAVSNAGMIDAGYDSLKIAQASGTFLTTLQTRIRYHIVKNRMFEADAKPGNINTVLNKSLLIGTTPAFTVKGLTNPSAFTISTADILATNGTYHIIPGLLIP